MTTAVGRRPLTLEDRVRISAQDVDYRSRLLDDAQRSASRTCWQHVRSSVICVTLSILTIVTAVVGSCVHAFGWLDGPGAAGSLGSVLTFFGISILVVAGPRFGAGLQTHRTGPEWVRNAGADLQRVRARLIDAEAAVVRETTERRRRRELPSALDMLEGIVATSSRDWSRDKVDARIYAIVCGWDDSDAPDDGGAWTELTAAHGWDAEYVQRLKDAREAYVLAAAAETRRRDEI